MKKLVLPLLFLICLATKIKAQNYSPIATTGYTLDAVAENTTALATTNGALDGSNFVLYSAAYGTIYSIVGGLPNSGLITSGGYTYQLQPYTQNNTLFMPLGTSDSLILNTPASFASISLLAFATEGTATMNVKLRFTDNTTQIFSNLTLDDWFNGINSIISGFGRASRSTGVITNPAGNPKMFNVDLNLTCANRLKSVQRIIVQNNSGNARVCVMAASGSGTPAYTATSTPVSCANGNNGTASLLITNNLPPNTYTWTSTPNQFTSLAANLTTGVYSYTILDAAGCAFSSTVAVAVSTVALPALQIGTSSTLVCSGTPVTLSTFGANTYTWSNSLNSSITSVTPNVNSTYSVAGTTGANCLLTGSVSVSVFPTTTVSFNSLPATMCVDASSVQLTAFPSGGTFSGTGVNQSVFYPNVSGAGIFTVNYSYTDANNCSYLSSLTTTVNALPVINFSASPTEFCVNAGSVQLIASPLGGNYTGQGLIGTVFSPSLAGVGTSTITYFYTDANACSANQSITLTVNALPSITINPIPTALCANAATFNLIAQPSGGTFSGQGVNGSAFSPTLAGLGSHTITYAYTNSITSCASTKTTSIIISACTGINSNEASSLSYLNIYPNPASNEVFIRSTELIKIEITNELGQSIGKYTLNSENNFTLNLTDLADGIYFVSALLNGQSKVQKLVISR